MGSDEKTQLVNVAVFVDYENVHKTLKESKTNVIRDGFFDKIRECFKEKGRRIVKIAVYCNFDNEDLYESHHQSLLQSYGVETIHTSNQGKNFADLQLTIDVMNAMYLNSNIDEFVIMSNDKDMTPLLNSIRYNKRKAAVITTGSLYNRALCSFADEQIPYEEILDTAVSHCMIDDLRDKIYGNLRKYFDNMYGRYSNDNISGNPQGFKHIGLDYFCEIQTGSCMLMRYEVYKCIGELNRSGKILFYVYSYNGKRYYALAPTDKKELLVSESIISKSDLRDYDVEPQVSQLYEK